MKEQGFSFTERVSFSKYLFGHPDIDNSVENIIYLPNSKDNDLHLFSNEAGFFKKEGTIPVMQIKNVSVEDASTIEKRVTVGRFLVMGVFAFFAKKDIKNELSYLIIEWNDGKFDHETIFEFQGKDAASRSHGAKNTIIRLMRKV